VSSVNQKLRIGVANVSTINQTIGLNEGASLHGRLEIMKEGQARQKILSEERAVWRFCGEVHYFRPGNVALIFWFVLDQAKMNEEKVFKNVLPHEGRR